ncbi:alpha/beta hydrolase [Dyadobacter luteus]|uniref:Alpha/beta hydrolase n=1 Tax=Dyadobacter luteus TaxID=2259619 RepID=A0A3D8Y9U2_9BACT|nr:alpha/beta hydrolase [Dyadobacter luteus]REA60371.1 alpha/beta hydrolase [Dyadobacter luteus]
MLRNNLHYHKLGTGPNILLAFHGIGQTGSSCFQPFADHLGGHYTIYAFDLYFHGSSNIPDFWAKDELISKKAWHDTIAPFLKENEIKQFDIAGFSMGGRFALATLELFPQQINKAFLIAPDGVSEHPLYTIASRSKAARSLFRWLMKNPSVFFKSADFLQKTGLIHSSLYRFTQQVLNTPEKRRTIYNSWVSFRDFHFNISSLYKLTQSQNIDLLLFTGKFDKLLKPSAVDKLRKLLPENKSMILQSGHTQLVEKVAYLIATNVFFKP